MKIPVYLLVISLLSAGLSAGFFLLLCEDQAGTGSQDYRQPTGFPKDSIIAEFGNTNKIGGNTSGIPFEYSRFLNETTSEIEPYYFPNGPIIGYGYGPDGDVVVMHYYDWHVNQSMIDEIYSRIAAKGKTYGFESIPCIFVSMDMPDTRPAAWTLPPGSARFGILFARSFSVNSSILKQPYFKEDIPVCMTERGTA